MQTDPLHPTITKINPAVEQNIIETLAEVKRVMEKFQSSTPPTLTHTKKKTTGTIILTIILANCIGVCGFIATQAIANHNTTSISVKK